MTDGKPEAAVTIPRPPATQAAALEQFFQEATQRFEDAVNQLRALLCVAVFVVVAATHLLGDPGRGSSAPTLTLMAAMAGAVASLVALGWLRAHRPRRLFLAASVTLDAVVVLTGVLPGALWPYDGYPGQLHFPPIYFFLLSVVAAGFRLDRRIVAWALALNVSCVGLLLAVDHYFNVQVAVTRRLDWAFAAILLAGAGFMAYSIAVGSRRLVASGARALATAEHARRTFGIYVSEEVATKALAATHLEPGGERREVVILFSDLRGFTAYSETLSPEALLLELNAYLDAMVTVIRDERGVVDKFIGDCIMVVFGMGGARADDARRAMRTAWRMEQALGVHNQARALNGRPPLKHGVGVHMGPVVVGNIGTEQRLQYTVIGDTVNTTSRLESACKELGYTILVSETVRKAAAPFGELGFDLAPAGELSLRGVCAPLKVFTLQAGANAAE